MVDSNSDTLSRQPVSYYKVCLSGPIGVGKTTMFERIKTGGYVVVPEVQSAIGAELYRTIIQTKDQAVPVSFY